MGYSFKANPVNKANLIRFIASEWRKENSLCRTKLGERNTVIIITCDEDCFKIMSNTVELVTELESSQEEADTPMMLHLAHISQYDFSCGVIASIDADVIFLCLTNYHKFPMPFFQKCCSETRMKYVDIPSIGNVLGRNVCETLPGIHAITGCDTISSFAGKGKLTAGTSTASMPVTKQLFGKDHWMLSLKFRLEKGGSRIITALAMDWMEGLPAPDAVLELMSCS